MAKLSFNAAKAKPMENRDFRLVDEGEYLVQIVDSEIKRNSRDTGDRLNMRAKILKGSDKDNDFKGSTLYIGLNWNHEKQDAQDISDREFKSICDAIGKGNDEIGDTYELHGIPFIATVLHSAPSGEYRENGEIKYKYKPKAEIKKYDTANGHELAEGVEVEVIEQTTKTPPPWVKKKEEEKTA